MRMTPQQLKRVHIFGAGWFLFCASALLIISLRQAGVNWWLVFSISGYSAVAFAFLLAFYLFALFRGVVRAQYRDEHPLSTSPAYLFLYDAAPFLGACAGLLGSIGFSDGVAVVRMVIEGTLGMTFVTWVILDSLVGGIESLLPGSIDHRSRRLAKARAEKQRIQQENAALLESLERSEQLLRLEWEAAFRHLAIELAELYGGGKQALRQAQLRTAEVGAMAWRTGKIACMRFVHQMVRDEMNRRLKCRYVDYAALCWDGI